MTDKIDQNKMEGDLDSIAQGALEESLEGIKNQQKVQELRHLRSQIITIIKIVTIILRLRAQQNVQSNILLLTLHYLKILLLRLSGGKIRKSFLPFVRWHYCQPLSFVKDFAF